VINYEEQLKIQAYLDGELSSPESKEIEALLARDPEAHALLAELKNTSQTFKSVEAEMKLPESREFYWSKIERQIQSQSVPTPAARPVSWLSAWRRFLAPAGALAAVLVVALFTLSQTQTESTRPDLETALADPGAFTYRDYDAGATLVWLSYPAENDVAADDTAGTVQ
jgi:anti-sigma factor RsiW